MELGLSSEEAVLLSPNSKEKHGHNNSHLWQRKAYFSRWVLLRGHNKAEKIANSNQLLLLEQTASDWVKQN